MVGYLLLASHFREDAQRIWEQLGPYKYGIDTSAGNQKPT